MKKITLLKRYCDVINTFLKLTIAKFLPLLFYFPLLYSNYGNVYNYIMVLELLDVVI